MKTLYKEIESVQIKAATKGNYSIVGFLNKKIVLIHDIDTVLSQEQKLIALEKGHINVCIQNESPTCFHARLIELPLVDVKIDVPKPKKESEKLTFKERLILNAKEEAKKIIIAAEKVAAMMINDLTNHNATIVETKIAIDCNIMIDNGYTLFATHCVDNEIVYVMKRGEM